jgi:hypothetical protein
MGQVQSSSCLAGVDGTGGAEAEPVVVHHQVLDAALQFNQFDRSAGRVEHTAKRRVWVVRALLNTWGVRRGPFGGEPAASHDGFDVMALERVACLSWALCAKEAAVTTFMKPKWTLAVPRDGAGGRWIANRVSLMSSFVGTLRALTAKAVVPFSLAEVQAR